jgi:hypothetical protein
MHPNRIFTEDVARVGRHSLRQAQGRLCPPPLNLLLTVWGRTLLSVQAEQTLR